MRKDIHIKTECDEVYFRDSKASTTFELSLNVDEELVLSVDIYSFQPQNHPENHLGWWHLSFENGKHRVKLEFDFEKIGEHSLRASLDGSILKSRNHWVNREFKLDPLQECKLVFWNKNDEIVYLKRILLKIDDRRVLDSFYIRHFEKDGYSPEVPFLDLLHKYKLKILNKYFEKYFKGVVLDVGCGLSLFTEIKKKWDFKILAGDLVFGRIKERKEERPEITWIVFDALELPFKANTIDSIFAGEILEHLPRAELAVKEWNRVQKKDGILIVTTPNRKRRINRLNRQDWPFSPDHLREFSYEELNREILPGGDYEVLKKKGIYVELFARSNKWWKEDYLQREGNTMSNSRLMKKLFPLGLLFPKHSLVLISVAKKR